MDTSWAQRLAAFVHGTFHGDMPQDVLERAAFQLLDSVACAAGAHDSEAVAVVRHVVGGSGPAESTLWFGGGAASSLDALLVNGTAVRALDANDLFLGLGPAGHPSDNIPAVVAVGELGAASAQDMLKAIVLVYELIWRIRGTLFKAPQNGQQWDGVSVSGLAVAAVSAALMGGDQGQISQAIAIGAAKGYALREIRDGEISMLKAAANAVVARDGVLAAKLAMHGMTGPGKVIEGRRGLIRTLGNEPSSDLLDTLCAPAEWAIRNVSIKAFPAIGMAQAALSACQVIQQTETYDADVISAVAICLPDSPWTRENVGISQRHRLESRESADHSIPFLVSLCLLEGDVSLQHYDRERWRDDDVIALMKKTSIVADERLAGAARCTYPARIEIELHSGRSIVHEVIATPGSPENPWERDEIVQKWLRVDRTGLPVGAVERIADHAVGLIDGSVELAEFVGLVGAAPGAVTVTGQES